jgi:processive 1,2-diacylglycerol beta-glucosyltransferase
MSKKILILHASFGSGHVSAAEALNEAFAHFNVAEVRIEDTVALANSLVGSVVSEGYQQLAEKAPRLYGWLFEELDSDDADEAIKGNLWMGQLGQPFLGGLEQLISEMAPDAIICTMQWPAMAVGHLKKEGRIAQPVFVVVTDFIAHGSWFNYGVDAYFLPGEITRFEFLSRGVPEDLFHVTGIPIRLEITKPKPMEEMRARHQLPQSGPLITLFGGGIDSKRVKVVMSLLLRSLIPATLVVVAGRNETLMAEIADLADGPHMKLTKLERVDFVDDLVAASDLVITKAGGLIVSEVLARGTPMLIFEPLPGQEEWNADVVSGYGAGIQLRMPEMAALTALRLLTQPERLLVMRERAKEIGQPRAALDIAERILAYLEGAVRAR